MATRIRASCHECGDVELTVGDVEVRVCTSDNSGTYQFSCPTCSQAVVKPAEARVIDLLVASGVRMSTWDLPAEIFEPRLGGRPFSHDDLIDFHHLLETEEWFDDLLAVSDRWSG